MLMSFRYLEVIYKVARGYNFPPPPGAENYTL
jgi:hypothetical protein